LPDRPYLVPVHRGDRRELAIESLADGPDALAHVGGYVVFVAGALPDERVFAEITSSARKFGRARLLAVRAASTDRVPAQCRHFLRCGGCHWQHARYEAQLRYKQERVQKELAYALGEQVPAVLATAPAPAPFGQRHKVALQLLPDRARGLLPALHPLRDHELVPVQECPASEPKALQLAFAAVAELAHLRLPVFDPETGTGLLRSVLVRRAAATGQAHLMIVATAAPVPGLDRALPALRDAGAFAISVNVNDGEPARLLGRETHLLDGPRRIRDELDGISYLISPDAFFQTSPHGALQLVRAVCDGLAPGPGDRVLDLYCGGGLFALQLARRAGSVLGIEESPVAVGDAIAAQKQNRLRNAQFVQGPAEALLRRVRDGHLPQPTLAVLDPPRSGASPEALQQLAALAPARIAYVACDPRALARDLAQLRDLGYRAQSVLPVDMFPQTAHVEAVAVLGRST